MFPREIEVVQIEFFVESQTSEKIEEKKIVAYLAFIDWENKTQDRVVRYFTRQITESLKIGEQVFSGKESF